MRGDHTLGRGSEGRLVRAAPSGSCLGRRAPEAVGWTRTERRPYGDRSDVGTREARTGSFEVSRYPRFRPDAPAASSSFSRRVTVVPARASARAHAAPMIPPPTTTTSGTSREPTGGALGDSRYTPANLPSSRRGGAGGPPHRNPASAGHPRGPRGVGFSGGRRGARRGCGHTPRGGEWDARAKG
jgi:hypothetical protein